MSPSDQNSSEFTTAARRVSASLVEGIHLRLDLFALELGEERRRISQIVLSTLALALALFMVFLCANVALLIVFWDSYRTPLALGMCGFYGLLSALLAFSIERRARRRSRAFEATRAVLEADRRTIRESP
jgi:uncharacterized membrane protein YqjE